MMERIRGPLGLLGIAVLLSASACNNDVVKNLPSTNDVKEAVTAAKETVKQAAGAAGKMDLQFGGPLQISACYGAWLPPGGGRPNVLQITSYHDPAAESFPSMLVRCTAKPATLRELAGQRVTIDRAFVQTAANAPIWELPEGASGTLTLSNTTDIEFSASLDVSLVNVQTGKSRQLTGDISGAIQ